MTKTAGSTLAGVSLGFWRSNSKKHERASTGRFVCKEKIPTRASEITCGG